MCPLLSVRGLTLAYGPHLVLDGVDLDLAPGEAVAVVGPNGSGKSTLLRGVLGLVPVDAGEVPMDDGPLDERRPEVRRAVAGVLDDIDFFPDLSVVEHLDLLARAHGVADPETQVDTVLDDLGLLEVSGQLPATLSSGQRRRLALAGVFVRPRRLLVLDEPEQRLDVEGVDWLARRLRAEKEEGGAVLLASHHRALVQTVCDRVLRLDRSGMWRMEAAGGPGDG